MHNMKKRRTKEPNRRSSRSLFLLRASRTYENSSACVNMSRSSPQRSTPSQILRSIIRWGAALTFCAAFAIVVPAPKRAPAHAGTPSNRISAAGIGRYAGTFRSNPAGRRNNQKKLGLITLAASSAASPPVRSLLSRTRSRYRRLWAFRLSLPAGVARYFCCAFHADHSRAFFRHRALQ